MSEQSVCNDVDHNYNHYTLTVQPSCPPKKYNNIIEIDIITH
jgi:hypothetical protein